MDVATAVPTRATMATTSGNDGGGRGGGGCSDSGDGDKDVQNITLNVIF
jgi:hypothetical protein